MQINELARRILDRPPLFADDFEANTGRIGSEIAGQTVCVVGAGGSIGRATAGTLSLLKPRRSLLVDVSENNLAETTRILRNMHPLDGPDFEAWALDFTRPAFTALLEREQPGVILNFAAFKHVRSEKDVLTLSEMLRVNVLGNLKLVRWAVGHGGIERLFSISTDKAANPANCMGASKRLMEQVLFCREGIAPAAATTTSTRFANVLFSDGSLPASFLRRMEMGQPLAGPSDIRRYFITPQEAGRLCLLAAFHPGDREILVPNMREADLLDFRTIAERLLELRGFEPKHYGDDHDSAFANFSTDHEAGSWPCIFSPAVTSGEKEFEEFSEQAESASLNQPYRAIRAVSALSPPPWADLADCLDSAEADFSNPDWFKTADRQAIVRLLNRFVPSFQHLDSELNLDRVV